MVPAKLSPRRTSTCQKVNLLVATSVIVAAKKVSLCFAYYMDAKLIMFRSLDSSMSYQ